MYKYLFSFIFSVFIFVAGQAQMGLTTQFSSYPLTYEEEALGENFYDVSYGVALDYWFRLKNYRVESAPTIGFTFGPKVNSGIQEENVNSLYAISFHLKNNIYPFDFKNDCDCPTFSKQGGFFQKAFFFQIAPGYSYNQFTVKSPEATNSDTKHLFELGLGAGFDIGLSDLITLSPFFNYVITSKGKNELILGDNPLEKTNMNHLVVGLRLGLRPDYARPSYRSRRARGLF